jgi:hypothetical protein
LEGGIATSRATRQSSLSGCLGVEYNLRVTRSALPHNHSAIRSKSSLLKEVRREKDRYPQNFPRMLWILAFKFEVNEKPGLMRRIEETARQFGNSEDDGF